MINSAWSKREKEKYFFYYSRAAKAIVALLRLKVPLEGYIEARYLTKLTRYLRLREDSNRTV